MKLSLIFIYLFTSLYCFSQKSNNQIIQIDISCGVAAQTSKEIHDFRRLNNSKDFPEIRKKLVEGSYVEQVLSSILLDHYQAAKIVDLTTTEVKAINRIEKSRRKFSLCFTCTFQREGTLKQLFKQKLNGLIKECIFDSK